MRDVGHYIVFTEDSYKTNHNQRTWQQDWVKPSRAKPLEICKKKMANGTIKLLIYEWTGPEDV